MQMSLLWSRERRCSSSSSDYIWVINTFIAFYAASYIRGVRLYNASAYSLCNVGFAVLSTWCHVIYMYDILLCWTFPLVYILAVSVSLPTENYLIDQSVPMSALGVFIRWPTSPRLLRCKHLTDGRISAADTMNHKGFMCETKKYSQCAQNIAARILFERYISLIIMMGLSPI